jgi:hypothetical protein
MNNEIILWIEKAPLLAKDARNGVPGTRTYGTVTVFTASPAQHFTSNGHFPVPAVT